MASLFLRRSVVNILNVGTRMSWIDWPLEALRALIASIFGNLSELELTINVDRNQPICLRDREMLLIYLFICRT
jgi:hypothetical protein